MKFAKYAAALITVGSLSACGGGSNGQETAVLRREVSDLRQQLATTTTAAPVATSAPPSTTSSTAPATTTTTQPPTTTTTQPASLTRTGRFTLDAFFSSYMQAHGVKPSANCSGWGDASYQIQIRDGSGTTLGLATFGAGAYSLENKDGVAVMSCVFNYKVTVPVLPVYSFVFTTKSDTTKPIQTKTVGIDEFRQKGAPPFYRQESYT